MNSLPEHGFKEWLFNPTPMHFWDDRKNRRRYMKWLGEQLGYRRLDDWYGIRYDRVVAHRGKRLLERYHKSASAAVIDLIPRRQWHEWMFSRVPTGFWDRPENVRRYVDWLGKRLRIRRLSDWHRVGKREFIDNFGGSLLQRFGSHTAVLRKCLPELDGTAARRAS